MTPRRFLLSALLALATSAIAVIAALPAQAGTPSPKAARAVVRAEARASVAAEAKVVLAKLTAAGAGFERDGVAPSLPAGATRLGDLAASTPLAVDVALVPRNASALAEFATDVATPGSADYRRYITARQFATRYGAAPAAISAVRSALSAAGLTVGATSPNRLDIRVTGSAAQFERAFATGLESYRLATGRVAFANTQAPRIADSAARYVSAVVNLNDLAEYTAQGLEHPDTRAGGGLSGLGAAATTATTTTDTTTTGTTTTTSSLLGDTPVGTPTTVTTTTPATAASYANGPTPCASATAYAATGSEPSGLEGTGLLADEDYNYDSFAKAYDFEPLYRAGDLGEGVNVGIFELEGNYATDVDQFDNCYGIDPNINYVPVDGGATQSGSSGEETALDIDTITALAPDANVTVYQGDGDDAWLDTFNAIVSADDDQVVSVSYGVCELLESTYVGNTPQADLPVFEEAAVQGQSFVASSGDAGAEGCRTPDAGTSALPTVEDPSADPFVTGVGGTSLTAVNGTSFNGTTTTYTAPTESVWNNGAALDLAGQGGGGGGGLSTEWLMPSYQSDPLGTTTTSTSTTANNVAALDIENSESEGLDQNAGVACSGDAENALSDVYCREVPDVSASADPYYAFNIVYDGDFAAIGGTSGAAPLWAALLAVADSTPGCQADPVGFANPALYRIAATSAGEYARDFNDITTGNNDAYGTDGGYYNAMTGYDMASGLGTPIAANLIADLCPTPAASTGTSMPTTTAGTSTSTTGTSTGDTSTAGDTSTTAGASPSIAPAVVTQTVTTAVKSPTVTNSRAAGSTTVKPTCKASKQLSFVQHPAAPALATKAVVYIDGTRIQTIRSKQIFVVRVERPTASTFTVKIVTTLNDGEVLSHQITYQGCQQTHVIYRTLHKVDRRIR